MESLHKTKLKESAQTIVNYCWNFAKNWPTNMNRKLPEDLPDGRSERVTRDIEATQARIFAAKRKIDEV